MATEGRAQDPAVDDPELDREDASIEDGDAPALPAGSQWRYNLVQELLRQTPYEFRFFQAVRLLERIYPERRSVGRFFSPDREVARFNVHAHLAFPASQIQHIEWTEDRAPVMTVNFFGLFGPLGVLPKFYTELIMKRVREKDTAIRAFFDIFNHRMISLFYQAWEKYRFAVAFERGERDRLALLLLDVAGLGTRFLQNRQEILDDTFIFYSGLLSIRTRPADALRAILEDYFDVPVEVEQFVGSWQPISRQDQCQFDKASTYSEQLGVGVIVGDEIWDPQSGVLIRIGPLPLAKYLDFLPTGTAWKPLRTLLRFFSGFEIDFQVQLILRRQDVPPCELGREGDAGPKLGWVSWSKNIPMKRDPDDTILRA
jgi:type VI secretion system protein ImpH